MVARATIDTLRDFPELNATLDGDTITRYERVHLGIAVSLGDDGLIVPRSSTTPSSWRPNGAARACGTSRGAPARRRSPSTRSRAGRSRSRTRERRARSSARRSSTSRRWRSSTLEAVVRRPVVVRDADGGESIAIRPMVNLVLGWDHRAIDGLYAARFLTALRGRLESAR